MRSWIQHLLNYPQMQADFEDWLAKIRENLLNEIEKAANDGNTEKLSALAVELSVYRKIGNAVKAERKEVQAMQKFTNQKE